VLCLGFGILQLHHSTQVGKARDHLRGQRSRWLSTQARSLHLISLPSYSGSQGKAHGIIHQRHVDHSFKQAHESPVRKSRVLIVRRLVRKLYANLADFRGLFLSDVRNSDSSELTPEAVQPYASCVGCLKRVAAICIRVILRRLVCSDGEYSRTRGINITGCVYARVYLSWQEEMRQVEN
jgi:hypothetical protein